MEETRTAAVTLLMPKSRVALAVIYPKHGGMLISTLAFAEEWAQVAKGAAALSDPRGEPKPEELEYAVKLVEMLSTDDAEFLNGIKDVQADMKVELIERAKAGRPLTDQPETAATDGEHEETLLEAHCARAWRRSSRRSRSASVRPRSPRLPLLRLPRGGGSARLRRRSAVEPHRVSAVLRGGVARSGATSRTPCPGSRRGARRRSPRTRTRRPRQPSGEGGNVVGSPDREERCVARPTTLAATCPGEEPESWSPDRNRSCSTAARSARSARTRPASAARSALHAGRSGRRWCWSSTRTPTGTARTPRAVPAGRSTRSRCGWSGTRAVDPVDAAPYPPRGGLNGTTPAPVPAERRPPRGHAGSGQLARSEGERQPTHRVRVLRLTDDGTSGTRSMGRSRRPTRRRVAHGHQAAR